MSKLVALEHKLDFIFNDKSYLEQALSHSSAVDSVYAANQRMEFLGDALLGWLVSRWLYQDYTDYAEGRLTRLRARIVSRVFLAEVARHLQLDQYISVDKSSFTDGISDRVLADTMEAVFAAMYLDQAELAADKILACLQSCLPVGWEMLDTKDAKTMLQEYTQQQGLGLPKYTATEQQQQYSVTLTVADLSMQEQAEAIKPAEQRLAKAMLARLQQGD